MGGGISGLFYVSMILTENSRFGAPQFGLLCGAALPRAVSLRKSKVVQKKTCFFLYFLILLYQNGPNLLLSRGTTITSGILTLIEFWWVP